MDIASLSNLDTLSRTGSRGGVDMRPTLLRVLTDLYVQKLTHTAEEELHYSELALRLLEAVDVTTRIAVSARLARHLAPPLRVLQKLAADLPDVAAPVRCHPALTGGIANAPKTSASPAAPPPVLSADEARAAIPDAGKSAIVTVELATELDELFFAASADERRLILLNLQIAAPIPQGQVVLVRDIDMARRLENAALTRNRTDFVKHLAQALQISRELAGRIATDALGEPIAIASKALAIPREIAYRILLFVNTAVGHSVERVHALAALYDDMTSEAAEHMVAIWQAAEPPSRNQPTHQPLSFNDQARARARTATVAVRRAPAVQRPSERRDAS